MKKTIISSLILHSCTLSVVLGSTPPAASSRLNLSHREGGGIGYSKGYTSLDYFLTAQPEKIDFLLDLRAHIFNDSKLAANAGFGLRFPMREDTYVLGANFFYDFRQSPDLFAHQIGAGVEGLSKNIDFRINGYLPVGTKRHTEIKLFDAFSGTTVLMHQRLKATLPAIEGEVGTALAQPFYFAIGSYYLFRQESRGLNIGNIWGGKARFDIDLGRYFKLSAMLTYDRVFHTRLQGVLSLNIPLGRGALAKKKQRNLHQVPIVRNEIIPIQTKSKYHTPLVDEDNQLIEFLFVNNTASHSGNGSIEAPFASLKEAEAISKPGSVIYVFPGDGTPKNMDEGIVLKENQILASTGAALEVENMVIPPLTPGESPAITNIHPGQPVVVNPGHSNLDNFILIRPWEYIFGNIDFDSSPNPDLGFTPSYNAPALNPAPADLPAIAPELEIAAPEAPAPIAIEAAAPPEAPALPLEVNEFADWEVIDGEAEAVHDLPSPDAGGQGGLGGFLNWSYFN